MLKKILSLILCVVMLTSVFTTVAFAQEEITTAVAEETTEPSMEPSTEPSEEEPIVPSEPLLPELPSVEETDDGIFVKSLPEYFENLGKGLLAVPKSIMLIPVALAFVVGAPLIPFMILLAFAECLGSFIGIRVVVFG